MNKKQKMKVRKSISRRIKVSAGGKLLRRRSFGRHLKAGKRKMRSRRHKQPVIITGTIARKIRKALGL